MRQQDKIIIWPAYFDIAKTRKQGRQVAKNLAVALPRMVEIKEAAEKLGFACEAVQDAAYSKAPNLKTGMVLVKKREPKNQTIRNIGKLLVQMRRSATPPK